jgi:hypothetical protein
MTVVHPESQNGRVPLLLRESLVHIQNYPQQHKLTIPIQNHMFLIHVLMRATHWDLV